MGDNMDENRDALKEINNENLDNDLPTSNDLNNEKVCIKCGAKLESDQDFCPKCGTAKQITNRICPKCGASMKLEHEFCTKCGQNLGVTAIDKHNKLKKLLKIGLIILSIIFAILILGFSISHFTMNYEDYLIRAEYEKAYEKAESDEEILAVLCENAAAKVSYSTLDLLKDPTSFNLRNAFFLRKEDANDKGKYVYCLVLQISAKNSFGAATNSYWFYEYDCNENQWSYWTSVTDLEQEEFKSWDDYEDEYQKLFRNIVRECIGETMLSGVKLSDAGVERINNMFNDNTLKNVKLLDVYDDAGTSLD